MRELVTLDAAKDPVSAVVVAGKTKAEPLLLADILIPDLGMLRNKPSQ